MSRASVVFGVVCALVVVAAPARAAAPWADPQQVDGAYMARWSDGALDAVTGQFAFTPGGDGIAVLGRQAGGWGIARYSGRRGAFAPLKPSGLGGVEPRLMATYGRDGLLLGGSLVTPATIAAPPGLVLPLDAAVSRGSGSGAFARAQVLGRGSSKGRIAPAYVAALAVNQSGDAAAVVSAPVPGRVGVRGYESRLYVRRRGQATFARVAQIGHRTYGASPAALAVNGPGDVLVAWDDRTSVRARLLTSAGHLGREQRLGEGGASLYGERLVATMDGTRRMLVAWMAQRVGEGSYAGSPGTVSVAYAPPYASFGPAHVVQRGLPKGADRAIEGHAVQAALLRDRGVVTWTGFAGGHYRVRTVDVTSTAAPGAPRELSGPGADRRLQGMAAGPRGGTVAIWFESKGAGSGAQSAVRAAVRPAGADTWGAPEDVAPWGPGDLLSPAPVGVSPVSGAALVVWSAALTMPPAAMPVLFSLRSP